MSYSAGVRQEKYNWGYNELAKFLSEELDGRTPAKIFEMKYLFLEKLHDKAVEKAQERKLKPYSAVIIYDGNVDHMAQLWTLDRLNIYHGWPVVKTEQYIEFAEANGITDLTEAGFESYYFIIPTENVLLRKPAGRTRLGADFESELNSIGVNPLIIKNKRGEDAFRVYKF